ncbi:MAG: hypothetical protein JXR95_08885 [Deltaproteobacteria bacterium]|nr:hypothetical protein [Deltaproteobacteria bacterium]
MFRNLFYFTMMLLLSMGCKSIDDSNKTDSGIDSGFDSGVDSSEDADSSFDTVEDDITDIIDPAWYEDDPEGFVTPDNLIQNSVHGSLVIITGSSLKTRWEYFAGIKNSEGISTEVVTMDEISSAYQGVDDAEKLRNFLKERYNEGTLRFALMGGDSQIVPFRRVENYIMVTEEYTSNGPSQLYFSNLSVDFDADSDGVFGEKDEDFSLEAARNTDIAVGRVSVSTEEELSNYIAKYLKYSSGNSGKNYYPLLLSDIASTLPIIGAVDAAEGVESTFDAFFPEIYTENVKKLYATESAAGLYGGEVITVEKVREALSDGYGMIFHNGHGSHGWLTDILNAAFVDSLTNTVPPVMLSCACLTGNFADVAVSSTFDGWSVQTEDQDSAGEKFINNPEGGVAYVGNTGTGLGPIGGSQFLHAMYEGLFVMGYQYIGEAFNYGRTRARSIEYSLAMLPVSMTDDSEWWTSHAIILLGDPSLRIPVNDMNYFSIETPVVYGPGINDLSLIVKNSGGEALSGAKVSLFKEGDFRIEGISDNQGHVTFNFIPRGPGEINVIAQMDGYFFFHTVILPDI